MIGSWKHAQKLPADISSGASGLNTASICDKN